MAVRSGDQRKEVEFHGVRAGFRTALREELEAARRASASGAIQLVNGRRIAQVGAAYQYLFLVESALSAPDDSPGDLAIGIRVSTDAPVRASAPLNPRGCGTPR